MLTPETNYIIAIEQHKDRIRSLEQRYLLDTIGSRNRETNWYRWGCRRTGNLLKIWGARLEQYGDPTSSKTISVKI